MKSVYRENRLVLKWLSGPSSFCLLSKWALCRMLKRIFCGKQIRRRLGTPRKAGFGGRQEWLPQSIPWRYDTSRAARLSQRPGGSICAHATGRQRRLLGEQRVGHVHEGIGVEVGGGEGGLEAEKHLDDRGADGRRLGARGIRQAEKVEFKLLRTVWIKLR